MRFRSEAMKRKTRAELNALTEKAFEMLKEGMSIREVADRLGTWRTTLMNQLHTYEPYVVWHQQISKSKADENARLLELIIPLYEDESLPCSKIAERIGSTKGKVDMLVRKHHLQRKQPNMNAIIRGSKLDIYQNHIMESDVERFAEIVEIGDVLKVDAEFSGLVRKKYPHYAEMDCGDIDLSGGYPWNLLCVLNSERIGK